MNITQIFQILSDISVIIAVVVYGAQLVSSKRQNTISSYNYLFNEFKIIRGKFNVAKEELVSTTKLLKEIKNDYEVIYCIEEVPNIISVAYFYENIGVLIKNDLVSFDVIFDMFYFPDWLYFESLYIRKYVREEIGIRDFWLNIDYIYSLYDFEKKYFYFPSFFKSMGRKRIKNRYLNKNSNQRNCQ